MDLKWRLFIMNNIKVGAISFPCIIKEYYNNGKEIYTPLVVRVGGSDPRTLHVWGDKHNWQSPQNMANIAR